jgi:hypothetical protein
MRWTILLAVLVACGGGSGGNLDGGAPCSTSDDCPQGNFCSTAEVCLPDGFCAVTADCGEAQVCADTKCIDAGPCVDDGDCEVADTFCSAGGTCIPDGTCAADGDCDDADFCSETDACIADGSCALNADCDAGMICADATSTCEPGSDCGATELELAAIPPNLLLTLDRSCSMKDKINNVPKWTSAVNAINTLTTDYDDQIRWGLGLFPDKVTPDCGQEATFTIEVGDDNETAIQTLLTDALVTTNMFYPSGPCVTNIDTAMQQAAAQAALDDTTRQSFVMLITDGKQSSCAVAGGDDGTEGIIDTLYQDRGVITFVVGFGGLVDVEQMNTFADLGGSPLAGVNHFYSADNQVELEAALETIAGLVVSCEFVVSGAPGNLNEVFAFFDDEEQVPRDPTHTEGWDIDPATDTLTFYGSYCQRLKDRSVEDVDVVFGCPGPVVE